MSDEKWQGLTKEEKAIAVQFGKKPFDHELWEQFDKVLGGAIREGRLSPTKATRASEGMTSRHAPICNFFPSSTRVERVDNY